MTTNYPPVATNDNYIVLINTTLTIGVNSGVLSNDFDLNGDALAAVLVNGPAHGTLNLTNTGGFRYTPTNSYVGTDSFTYVVSDGLTNSAAALVTITVTTNPPPDNPPVARPWSDRTG